MRFALYGTFFTAPTLYCWVRIAGRLFPHKTVVSAIKKAALEQITYNPLSTSSFFFIMTYAETFNFDKARDELRNKFWDTYKVWYSNIFYKFLCVVINLHRSLCVIGPLFKLSILPLFRNAIAWFLLVFVVYSGFYFWLILKNMEVCCIQNKIN